jgi:2-polyprenyl-6-methoxyphenol hydroxylase-like FAD-dependent oxidoreductase
MTEVVVVGARVAGAATAMLLARRGHDVLLLDRAELPSDTVSTHQIARTGVVALRRWGLLDEVLATGAPPLRQITFVTDGTALTRPIRDSAGVDHLVAPRRYALDAVLGDAARRSGARLRTGVTLTGLERDADGRVAGVTIRDRRGRSAAVPARFVVGADGLGSRVARSVDAAVMVDRGAGGATRYAYFIGPDWPGIEFHNAERGLAGIFPTNGNAACVWLCTPEADARAARRAAGTAEAAFAAELRRLAPRLVETLRGARRVSAVCGQLHSPNQLRRAAGPGWALVGDAGFHRDPVSAHGISDAFRDAEFLATSLDAVLRDEAAEAQAMAGYHERRDAAARPVLDLTAGLVAYPSVPEFVALMRELGTVIDAEAADLAALPAITTPSTKEYQA